LVYQLSIHFLGPVITHGPIAIQRINVVDFRVFLHIILIEIAFQEVCEAIMETAFKSSDYPIVLSLENHCCPSNQDKMANHFIEVFGEYLQERPLDSHPVIKYTDKI
jgi:hypothetical protein